MSSFAPLSLALLAAGVLVAAGAHAAPQFVNGIAIPATTIDATGVPGANAGRVGFFSDIYYDPNRNEWWGLSDRGPGGGTIPYETRVQRFTLDVDTTTGAISNFRIAQTVKFTRADGTPFDGIAPNPTSSLGNALDPEGFVVNPVTGHFYVSDEYGPSLYEFDRQGVFVQAFATPDRLVAKTGGVDDFGTTNTTGRRTNRGFEGLAVSADGSNVYAMLQSAMIDEGGASGVMNRIVQFDTATHQADRQFAYRMDTSGQGRGISALVAVNDTEFLVLERNNRGLGSDNFASPDKRVYAIDVTGADDVSNVALANTFAGSTVTKGAMLVDLDADRLAELGNQSPEKWEGLAVGPRLADGSYLLLAGTDNDYSVTQNGTGTQFDVYTNFADPAQNILCPLDATTGCTTIDGVTPATLTSGYGMVPGVLHAYRVTSADIGGYMAPVPEPGTWAMMGLGLAGLAVVARRRAR
jgi:hypothetical protein